MTDIAGPKNKEGRFMGKTNNLPIIKNDYAPRTANVGSERIDGDEGREYGRNVFGKKTNTPNIWMTSKTLIRKLDIDITREQTC